MHAARHTSRGVYTMFWTLTVLQNVCIYRIGALHFFVKHVIFGRLLQKFRLTRF